MRVLTGSDSSNGFRMLRTVSSMVYSLSSLTAVLVSIFAHPARAQMINADVADRIRLPRSAEKVVADTVNRLLNDPKRLLEGAYSFRYDDSSIDLIGSFVLDGGGYVTQSSIPGFLTCLSNCGSYDLSDDGTGILTLQLDSINGPIAITVLLAVAEGGDSAFLGSGPTFLRGSGEMRRQHSAIVAPAL